jgi:hypothetical protein
MNITEFEKKHNVGLIRKDKSIPMKIIGFFSSNFMNHFWTTYRLPFQKKGTITYPKSNNLSKYKEIPEWAQPILEHELIHIEDMKSGWGLFKMFWLVWLLPLPIIFSGRWFIERHAYLHNILNHGRSIEDSVNTLWSGYLWAWPKCLMQKWFNKKVKEKGE